MKLLNIMSRRSGSLTTVAAAAAFAGAASLPAQPGMGTCPWNTSTIASGTSYGVGGHHHGLALSPGKFGVDHTTWSLVRDTSASKLFLRRSLDAGCNNFQTTNYDLRTANQTGGRIVMGNDCKTLHILFQGPNSSGTGFSSVYYDAWCTSSSSWIGSGPQEIAQGVSTNYQYDLQDIEVTAKGRIVISYNCAEPGGPGQPWFNSWWSSVLRVAEPPAGGTQAVFLPSGHPVNAVPTESWGVNLHAVGECVHVSFFAPTQSIYYRGFDANGGGSWKQAANITLPEAQQATVISSITTDDDCSTCDYKIYVLFASRASGCGDLWLSCAANSSLVFTTGLVDTDKPLMAARNYLNFTLADGPNREVYVVYSKRSESGSKLYVRRYVNCVGAPRCTIEDTTIPDRFREVSGSRSSLVMSNPYVTVSDTKSVWLRRQGNTARTVSFGRYADLAPLPSVPRLTATNTPTDGGPPFCVAVCDVPPNLPGVLYIGFNCVPEWPLPLPFVPGSYFKQDVVAAVSYITTSCGVGVGHWQTCLPITGVIKGQSLYMQAVQFLNLTPALVPSNSMAVIFDDL